MSDEPQGTILQLTFTACWWSLYGSWSIFVSIVASGFSSDIPIGSEEKSLPLKKPSDKLETPEAVTNGRHYMQFEQLLPCPVFQEKGSLSDFSQKDFA